MNHLTDDELFSLLDGECSTEERTAYRTHLAECLSCQTLYKEFSAIDSQLSAMPLETPSVAFTDRLLEKLQPSAQLFAYRGLNNLNFLFLAIGLVVLVTAVSLLMMGPINLPAMAGMGKSVSTPVDLTFLRTFFQSPLLKTFMLVVNGILALLLVDKLVLQPFFNKRQATV
jgi:anti-sigma factor RsiW